MHDLTRRRFIRDSLGLCGLAVAPLAWGKDAPLNSAGLSFQSLHTGEKLQTGILPGKHPEPTALAAVNHVLRDHRSGEIHAMDPELLMVLAKLQNEVGIAGPFHVISGYRSPKTNAKLRTDGRGVAKKSLHMQGKAIDVRLPGCELATLRDAAISLKAGGVGYYAKSDFIHIDTGRVRYW